MGKKKSRRFSGVLNFNARRKKNSRTLIFSLFFAVFDDNHEVRRHRILGVGDGRSREGAHTFHQTGSARGHGPSRHVDDAQIGTGLSQDIVQADETGRHGRKTFGIRTREEVYRRRGE